MKKNIRGILKLPRTFIKALTDFKYYKTLDKLSRGQAILYIVFISLLLSIIAVIPSAIAVNSSMQEFQKMYIDFAPDFVINEGKLSLPEPGPVYMIDDPGKAFVVVFDDTDSLTEVNFRDYESVLLMDSDSAFLRSPMGNQDVPYITIFPGGIDKAGFATYLNLVKLTNIVFIVFYIITFILFNMLGVFFIAALGNLMLSFKKMRLGFSRSFGLACYAASLPVLLKTVMHVFSINLQYFDAIFVLVGVLYFWNAGIQIMKADKPPEPDQPVV